MEDIDYSYVNGSPEGELPPPSPIQQLQPQQPVHDDWGLGEQLQPQQPAHDDWGLGEQLQPQQPAHDDWEAGPQQPQQQPQQPPALLVEHAPVVRPDNFNRQRGNGWFRGQCRHSDLLRARTARLANRLHAEILAGRWRAAVDTLKNILDLDPDNRHPPLYGWSASAWDDVIGINHEGCITVLSATYSAFHWIRPALNQQYEVVSDTDSLVQQR
ncbi:hypothetical protein OUZ56_003286 [Daphnia magna]|uniref:Uncharacterized protein n=1 Tax=Daphnia magna TaxID=35525 RepID=A0ABR0A8Q0_9CRUS|nr:hypothetical protein OUZ56_003286 [Daphnia magna]